MAPAVAVASAAVTVGSMIAFPLARPRRVARRRLSHAVVGGLAATTTALATGRWRSPRTTVAAVATMALAATVEHVGTTTGRPFGRYRYSGDLRPAVFGVPVVVPAAWWAMALPAREAAHAALGRRSSPLTRIGLGSVALTAWDLFLDPQMTAEGYWRWARRGAYRGIPLSNFAGWLVTGAAVMAAVEVLLPPARPVGPLVAEYAGMAAMETAGFAAFFRDPLVAVVGAVGMVPIAGAAVAGIVRGCAG